MVLARNSCHLRHTWGQRFLRSRQLWAKNGHSFCLRTPGGLRYYGYRWSDPVTGRWVSRDPIGENGGKNLHAFLVNAPISINDYLGLQCKIQGKCDLVSESGGNLLGLGTKNCEYRCVEDSSIDRVQQAGGFLGGPAMCDEIPKPFTWTETRRKRCCEQSVRSIALVADMDWGDCSRKECRDSCGKIALAATAACFGNKACKKAVEEAKALCEESCNSVCKRP